MAVLGGRAATCGCLVWSGLGRYLGEGGREGGCGLAGPDLKRSIDPCLR